MRTVCGHCGKTLEFSGHPPAFCAYCGVRLTSSVATSTPTMPGEATVAYAGSTDTGDDFAPPSSDAPSTIGGYALRRVLGVGGMGTVYEGVDPSGQGVAVKLLSPQFAKNAASLDRFRQEGRLASTVAHPHCVFVLAADEDAGRPYIVMELMPGRTLREEVEERGPLPPLEAVRKILDVIDGLSEAHRLGILHRDVKPSNCFVLPDGRVKVGDFGLSKSLAGDNNLTQTGSFLGTVLYAAPEQIRGDGLDFAADVYSVSATLYFLLTRRAPFQHENAAAVLARAVSEDPPPVRQFRPDVPARLERIVLKGLERSKERRYQTLDELRDALRELLPATATRGTVALRFAAMGLDSLVLSAANLALVAALHLGFEELAGARAWVGQAMGVSVEFLYFALLETLFGCTLGKYALRLRVTAAGSTERAAWWRVVLRTVAFIGLTQAHMYFLAAEDWIVASVLLKPIGYGLILATMRRRNGYRGLHEFASGTRTIQLPWVVRRRTLKPLRDMPVAPLPTDGRYPAACGPFAAHGVLAERADTVVLIGEDAALKRPVHLWLRPASAPPLPEARRTLARPARPRWLAAGTAGGWQWDAFLAPPGGPLADVVEPGRTLTWTETRSLLDQLADELAAAETDGTRPTRLGIGQVWLRPDGQVQLLAGFAPPAAEPAATDVALLARTTALALNGEERPGSVVRAVVPGHSDEFLARLVGEDYTTLGEVRTALAEDHDRPTETTRPMRLAHLGVQATLIAPVLAMMVGMTSAFALVVPTTLGFLVGQMDAAIALAATPDEMPPKVRQEFDAAGHPGAVATELRRMRDEAQDKFDERSRHANLGERFYLNLMREQMRSPGTVRAGSSGVTQQFTEAGRRLRGEKPRGVVKALPADFYPTVAFWLCAVYAGIGLAWVAWAFAFRGGLTMYFMNLALKQADGRKAARWRCAWRSLLVWTPVVGLLCGLAAAKLLAPERPLLASAAFWSLLLLLIGYVVVALRTPERGPHDQLAGTFVVPR